MLPSSIPFALVDERGLDTPGVIKKPESPYGIRERHRHQTSLVGPPADLLVDTTDEPYTAGTAREGNDSRITGHSRLIPGHQVINHKVFCQAKEDRCHQEMSLPLRHTVRCPRSIVKMLLAALTVSSVQAYRCQGSNDLSVSLRL